MNDSFQRAHLQVLRRRLEEPRRFIQVILGPRQVGKTTLVSQCMETLRMGHRFVAADTAPAVDSAWVETQWAASRQRMAQAETEPFLLVIDEIQNVRDWSSVVKRLWDEDTRERRDLRVVLLGSSRLLLQKGLSESLAGRFETIHMGHWSFDEMHKAFGWDARTFVWFGGYPGAAPLIGDERRWKDYVRQSLIETSISRDILMLSRIDKPALMKRLFELGCSYSGQILSFTKILGQLTDAGNTTTLSHYLDLLDTAGLLAGLEKYAGDRIRKRGSSPKFQVHNTALIRAQSESDLSQATADTREWGRLVESAVGAHLLAHAHSQSFTVHYWREGNDEVDFVIERDGRVIGIEVKSGYGQATSSLSSFQRKMSPDRVYIVGEAGIPWADFLRMDPGNLF
ncbi:MAG: ATP-binding protein [Chitinophagia bacterium]|nr:ATP-binding protein [Chitinophagia bacterium]